MFARIALTIGVLAALLPGAAQAQAQAQDKCQLILLNKVQMTRLGKDGSDTMPVLVNGQTRNFLFDTGGLITQIGRPLAEELKLKPVQGNGKLIDATGQLSRDIVSVPQFQVARMVGKDVPMMVAPLIDARTPFDGIIAPDLLRHFDIDVDFSTDVLNFFSPDHCDGQVVYWKTDAVAVIPIDFRSNHIVVPVTLDGSQIHAMIDTGASQTLLEMKSAKFVYNLTMGDAATPENGVLNGDATLTTYGHVFKSLSFGGIAVNNPHMTIYPDALGRNLDPAALTGTHIKTERDLIETPELIIGMDVLRKLHVYIAFGEGKMYISPASVAAAPAAVTTTGQ